MIKRLVLALVLIGACGGKEVTDESGNAQGAATATTPEAAPATAATEAASAAAAPAAPAGHPDAAPNVGLERPATLAAPEATVDADDDVRVGPATPTTTTTTMIETDAAPADAPDGGWTCFCGKPVTEEGFSPNGCVVSRGDYRPGDPCCLPGPCLPGQTWSPDTCWCEWPDGGMGQ